MQVIKLSMVRILFCLLLCNAVYTQQVSKPVTHSTPNIIVILADDMGKECIGAYGSTYNTPNVNRLAEEGLKFDYGFSQPLCTPSRVELMTGKYNNKNYVQFGYLDPYQTTFAHLAKQAGYVTAIAGKWQLGANNKLPAHFGFDNYCLWQLSYTRAQGERYAKPLVEKDGVTLNTTEDDYGPNIFTDYILKFIEDNKDKKFLAYYPMALVHDPFLTTPQTARWNEGAEARHQQDTSNFRDMVAYCDKGVGKIIDKLKSLQLYENTIIIFTGDNGTGRPIITPMQDGSSVKGGKGLTVDRGDRVPLIVNWGSNHYTKHVTDDLIDFSDFLPTIAEAMHMKVPDSLHTDGISFYPQIKGEEGIKRKWVFTHYNPLHSPGVNKYAAEYFRDHRYKLYQDGKLYDLQNDPEETTPIPENTGSAEAESARKIFQKEFAKLPAWKPGDPGKPKRFYPGIEVKESTGE